MEYTGFSGRVGIADYFSHLSPYDNWAVTILTEAGEKVLTAESLAKEFLEAHWKNQHSDHYKALRAAIQAVKKASIKCCEGNRALWDERFPQLNEGFNGSPIINCPAASPG